MYVHQVPLTLKNKRYLIQYSAAGAYFCIQHYSLEIITDGFDLESCECLKKQDFESSTALQVLSSYRLKMNTVTSRYLKVKVHPKLLISQSKFPGPRKFEISTV